VHGSSNAVRARKRKTAGGEVRALPGAAALAPGCRPTKKKSLRFSIDTADFVRHVPEFPSVPEFQSLIQKKFVRFRESPVRRQSASSRYAFPTSTWLRSASRICLSVGFRTPLSCRKRKNHWLPIVAESINEGPRRNLNFACGGGIGL